MWRDTFLVVFAVSSAALVLFLTSGKHPCTLNRSHLPNAAVDVLKSNHCSLKAPVTSPLPRTPTAPAPPAPPRPRTPRTPCTLVIHTSSRSPALSDAGGGHARPPLSYKRPVTLHTAQVRGAPLVQVPARQPAPRPVANPPPSSTSLPARREWCSQQSPCGVSLHIQTPCSFTVHDQGRLPCTRPYKVF